MSSILKRNLHVLLKYNQVLSRYIKYYGLKNRILNFDDPVQLCTWSWKIRYYYAIKNLELFNYMVLKLEDILINPYEYLSLLMNFLGSEVHSKQWEFLEETHDQSRGMTFSTYRRIEEVLNSWEQSLSYEHQQYIKSTLREEMVQLQYV